MRTISAALQDAQASGAPRASVSVEAEARGFFVEAHAAWQELYRYDTGRHPLGSGATGANVYGVGAGLADGTALRLAVYGSALYCQRVTTPTSAAAWRDTAWTTVLASGVSLSTPPGVAVNGDTVRVFVADSTPKLQYVESTDGGQTWGSLTDLYNGAGSYTAFSKICATHDSVAGWVVAYNATTTGGNNRLRGGNDPGAAWDDWPVSSGGDGWRVAGVTVGSSNILIYLWSVATATRSEIGVESVSYSVTTGAFGWWQEKFLRVDTIGSESNKTRFYDWVRMGSALDAVLFGLEEKSGATGYSGVAVLTDDLRTGSVFGEREICEPVLFPAWTLDTGEWLTPVQAGNESFLLSGRSVVWGQRIEAAAGSAEPISYKYEQSDGSGGQVRLVLPPGFGKQLKVGQVLKISRRIEHKGAGGSESVRCRILVLRRGRERVEVLAYDALGILSQFIARRPVLLRSDNQTNLDMFDQIIRWTGVERSTASEVSSAYVGGFVWRPGESGLSALYRAFQRSKAIALPHNDGTLTVRVKEFPVFSKQEDQEWDVYRYGETGHPVISATELEDGRAFALTAVQGQLSTDPADGESWRIADGLRIEGLRPVPSTYTNRFLNSAAKLQAAVDGEQERLQTLAVAGEIETVANLGLELYDIVSVTDLVLGWQDKLLRVQSIIEEWDRGSLTQRLRLGEVDEDA